MQGLIGGYAVAVFLLKSYHKNGMKKGRLVHRFYAIEYRLLQMQSVIIRAQTKLVVMGMQRKV